MNLWVNRIGQLLILAVALFFLSCHEENSVLGYKNPNSKFKARYVELTIPSSVILRDSVRTSNYSVTGDVNRFLVGKYTDEKFGVVTSNVAAQYFTVTGTKLPATAAFDSITLELQFDLYHYGSSATTPQTISIYELDRALNIDSLESYYSKTSIGRKGQIGSKTFTIHTDDFDEFAASTTDFDTVITIKVPLDKNFGQSIFNSAITYRDATTAADSLFIRYPEFVKTFKGLLIKSEDGDKIVGFNPSAANSRMLLHYHEDTRDSLTLALGFGSNVSFNQITQDRSGTALTEISQFYQDYLQEDENRFIQAGTGILTKLDFSPFYAFRDTVDNILINSAELVIEGLETNGYTPPQFLSLRAVNPITNRIQKYSKADSASLNLGSYNGFIGADFTRGNTAAVVESDGAIYAVGDQSALLSYSSTRKAYSMVMSLFFQQLTRRDIDRRSFQNFVLHPASQTATTIRRQSPGKSVNRVIFPKDNIKLRIYYTKPTIEQ